MCIIALITIHYLDNICYNFSLFADTPSGQLPYLVIDGKKILTQSNAINRYLAKEFGELLCFICLFLRSIYSVLVSVSCPKALFHLESDNLFRITVVVADWLGWNPYHRSSFFSISDWIILKFKLIYRWNFLSALLEWRHRKSIRRYFQRRAFVASK